MIKNKKFKIAIIITMSILFLLFLYFSYTIYESEKMFYRYANDGDQWVCEKYNITLTCHVEENETHRPNYYLTAKIVGIDKKVLITDFRGGHCKTWTWGTSIDNNNDENIDGMSHLFISDYYIKDKNTLEITPNNSEMEIADIKDKTLVNMFKDNEVIIFKRVPKIK